MLAVLLPAWSQIADLGAAGRVRIRADRLVSDEATGIVHAQGHVIIESGDNWITADAATYDRSNRSARFEGQVTISALKRLVRGVRGAYWFDEDRGELDDVTGWDESTGVRIHIQGTKLIYDKGMWTLAGAHLQSSDRPNPAYQVDAAELTYVEGHSWIGRDVRARIFGMELVRLNYYGQEVTDPTLAGLQWVPQPGTSPQDGVYISWRLQRDLPLTTQVDVTATLGTLSGASGVATLTRKLVDGRGAVWGRAGWREWVGDPLRPELRWNHFGVGTSWRISPAHAGWRADAETSYSWVTEIPSDARETRTAFTVTGASRAFEIGNSTRLYFRGGASGFYYGSGGRYGYLWAGGWLNHRFGRDWRVWGGLVGYRLFGLAPLLRDDVEIPHELNTGVRVHLFGDFASEAEVRYDLDMRRTRYTSLALRYRSADFVYRVRYNVERHQWMLDLLLPDS
jgi:hypothetical protein